MAPCKKCIVLASVSLYLYKRAKARVIKRQELINRLFLRREGYGHYHCLIPQLLSNERFNLKKFLRIDEPTFAELVKMLKPSLQKFSTFRTPLSTEEKLAVTFRYMATGETYESLQFGFLIAANTISKIIPEVCDAIINVLGPVYMSTPTTANEWINIAEGFEKSWNFPNCIGSIDGKHIAIKKPKHSGTDYYNYKGFYSIVLLGIVDADYKFIRAEVGINGRFSDGGVWNRSNFNEAIENGKLDIPTTNNGFPMVFVGDDAFPLKSNLMKPYRARGLSRKQLIFNYRLSRARRVVVNAFGILAARFRVLSNVMLLDPKNVKKVVLSCCIMHNILRTHSTTASNYILNHVDFENVNNGQIVQGNWRFERIEMLPLESSRSNRAASEAIRLRDTLCNHFNTIGAVPFQNNIFI